MKSNSLFSPGVSFCSVAFSNEKVVSLQIGCFFTVFYVPSIIWVEKKDSTEVLWKQVSNIFSIAYLFFGFDVGFSKFSTKYSKLVENSGKTLKFDGEKNFCVLKKTP